MKESCKEFEDRNWKAFCSVASRILDSVNYDGLLRKVKPSAIEVMAAKYSKIKVAFNANN